MKRHLPATTRVVLLFCLGLLPVAAVLVAWQAGMFEPRLQRLIRRLQTATLPEDRAAAAKQLGEMGAEARPAAPALVAALGDQGSYSERSLILPQQHDVSQHAFSALKLIRGAETAVALANAIEEGGGKQQWRRDVLAARLLVELGREATPAAERLLDAIDGSKQGEIVKQSILALSLMDLDSDSAATAKALQVLPQFLSWEGETGEMATRLLVRLRPADESARGGRRAGRQNNLGYVSDAAKSSRIPVAPTAQIAPTVQIAERRIWP